MLCLFISGDYEDKGEGYNQRHEDTSFVPLHLPINAHSGQNQPDNFDGILQAKAKLVKYLKEKC